MAGWTPGHTTRPNPSPARDCGGEQTFHNVSGCGIFTHRNPLIIFNKNNIFRYFLINIHITRPSIIYYIIEALTISHLRMSYSWLTLYFLTFYTRFLNSTSCRYEDRPRLASVTERPIIPHPRTSDIFQRHPNYFYSQSNWSICACSDSWPSIDTPLSDRHQATSHRC